MERRDWIYREFLARSLRSHAAETAEMYGPEKAESPERWLVDGRPALCNARGLPDDWHCLGDHRKDAVTVHEELDGDRIG